MPASTQKKLTRSFLRKITELRFARESAAGGKVLAIDPDYAAFEASHTGGPPTDRDTLSSLKRQRDFALFKIDRAQARGNLADVKDATEQLRYVAGVIHDEEFRAFRTGRELGDMMPLADVCRVFRAIPYWLNRGVDDALAGLAKRLSAATVSGPLFPEEIRALAEPYLLASLVLAPAVRAAQITAPTGLPVAAVAAMREGCAVTIENGAAEFERLHVTPPPTPPIAA